MVSPLIVFQQKKIDTTKPRYFCLKVGPLRKFGVCPHERPLLAGLSALLHKAKRVLFSLLCCVLCELCESVLALLVL
jgi:hypothetical protein